VCLCAAAGLSNSPPPPPSHLRPLNGALDGVAQVLASWRRTQRQRPRPWRAASGRARARRARPTARPGQARAPSSRAPRRLPRLPVLPGPLLRSAVRWRLRRRSRRRPPRPRADEGVADAVSRNLWGAASPSSLIVPSAESVGAATLLPLQTRVRVRASGRTGAGAHDGGVGLGGAMVTCASEMSST